MLQTLFLAEDTISKGMEAAKTDSSGTSGCMRAVAQPLTERGVSAMWKVSRMELERHVSCPLEGQWKRERLA